VLDFSGTMTTYAHIQKALNRAPIAPEQLKVLSDTVYRKCDEVDGVRDGVIEDPRRCDFRPAADLPRCTEGIATEAATSCFSGAQVDALAAVFEGVSRGGNPVARGWPVGSDVPSVTAAGEMRSAWIPWFVGAPGSRAVQARFGETFLRYMAFGRPHPDYDWLTFDPDVDGARLQGTRAILDATNPDLSRFRARGGRILSYFGWADPALNPLMGIDYYERVTAAIGPATRDFYRLFMVPGMFHCTRGVGVNTFDPLTALVRWVEHGETPDTIAASRVVGGSTVRTRPLCPYPEVARYKGTGNVDDAANFACVR
jgi:hypothetical protein